MQPENLRAMLQLQQSMQQLGGTGIPGMPTTTGAAAPSPPAAGGLDFSSLLGTSTGAVPQPANNPFMFPFVPPVNGGRQPANIGGVGGSSGGDGGASSSAAPGQQFRVSLQSLQDMGFTDRAANIHALTASTGNVNRAIEILLDGPPEVGAAELETGTMAGDAAGQESEGQAGETPANEAAVDNGGDKPVEPKGSTEKKND